MDQDDKHLLHEIAELAQENNKILRKMQRSARFARIIHIFYWIVIIGLTLGAYYLIQPYIDFVNEMLGSDTIQSFKELVK